MIWKKSRHYQFRWVSAALFDLGVPKN